MKNLFILLLLIINYSCSKESEPETPIKDLTLYETKLDFNNDGIKDLNLKIGNSGTADVPQTAGFNSFYVTSNDTNLSFLSKNINLDDYWFEENKEVKIDMTSYFSYKYFYASLYQRNISKGNYVSEWTIYGAFNSNKILVFQDKRSPTIKYGWIKLDFDITTKKLIIKDYFETTLKTFITGKK